MKIVADEKIPNVKEYLAGCGELVLKSGRHLMRDDLLDADVLITRSVTKVNKELLQNTPVKFVGSVVTGKDHLDTEWLESAGIQWCTAEGANTLSVVEYIVCVIAALNKMAIFPDKKLKAAVIGVGRIGSLVVKQLEILGFDVLQCDPVRAESEADFVSTPLAELADLDFISLHTPLTKGGKHPTYHMIDKAFLLRQKKNSVLLNAGRGAVIDFSDLKEYGETLYWCLDVWENEPIIDFEVLDIAIIATPHIAGHSIQAKQRGMEIIYQKACELKIFSPPKVLSLPYPERTLSFNNEIVDWCDVVLKIYDPRVTTEIMKEALVHDGYVFDGLRNDFNQRYGFAYVTIVEAIINETQQKILQKLGIATTHTSFEAGRCRAD